MGFGLVLQNIRNAIANCGNMGGVGKIYFALYEDFLSMASKPDCTVEDRTLESSQMLSVGSDVLKPGKRLYEIYSTMEKGNLNAERQGEIDAVSNKINLAIFTPGLAAESLGLLNIPNQSFIFYVKVGLQMFRVGTDDFPAKLAPDGEAGTGDTTASAKGNMMNFFSYEPGAFGEVVDQQAILDMLYVEDPAFTIGFTPVNGATAVLLDATIAVAWSIDLKATDAQLPSIFKLESLDIDGNLIEELPFTVVARSAAGFTLTPDADFVTARTHRVSFLKAQAESINDTFSISETDSKFVTA